MIKTRGECADDCESLTTWRSVLRVLLETKAVHGKTLIKGAVSKEKVLARSRIILLEEESSRAR